jgi:sugar-specific transcriptional regulator TrmB
MQNIQQILIETGLNELEADVYLAVLELGESTVLPIAKKAGIKRTYCYDILSSLTNKGLVSYVQKNNRRRYQALDPKKMQILLKNRFENFQAVLPELASLYKTSGKPKVSFYEGENGIISIYEQLWNVNRVDAIASPSHIEKYLGDWWKNFSTKILLVKKLLIREMIPLGNTKGSYHSFFKKPYHELRFLPKSFKLTTDMMLFENKLALISYGTNLHAVVIEDSSIVETQKALFEIIWKKAERD